MTTNEHTEQSERALTDAQCDRAIESAGLWPLACVTPQNLALLRGLCRAAALLAADKAGGEEDDEAAIDYAEKYARIFSESTISHADLVNAVYWGMRYTRLQPGNKEKK